MSWPPTSNGTNVIIQGSVTTITWGTGGFSQGALANAIVKSMKVTERNSDFPIENGAGLTAQNVLLLDGINYEITVEDDSNITWPIGGAIINIVVPQVGVNGSSNTGFVNAEVINNDYNGARKTAGERVIMAKSFNLFSAG